MAESGENVLRNQGTQLSHVGGGPIPHSLEGDLNHHQLYRCGKLEKQKMHLPFVVFYGHD